MITISPEIGKSFVFDLNDKYVHFAFYFVFVIVWFWFLIKTKFAKNAKNLALITAILYGIIIEICQGVFTTLRNPDVYDVIANTLGALTGIIIIKLTYKNSKTTH
ncbi:VanZ family protein [Flavobacterium sp.]|uniref:VanZ family protein n=1 Tax=Flavobacterium sp. TaxID=239 RepID=UPI00334122C5